MRRVTVVSQDIFSLEVQAIVNPVNCMGVMGKGLALAFKQRFPDNYEHYRRACAEQYVQVGKMYVTTIRMHYPSVIVNFPTKHDWRDLSRLAYIEQGLWALLNTIDDLNITSMAVPALGCGCGELDWAQAKPLLCDVLGQQSQCDVIIIPPR